MKTDKIEASISNGNVEELKLKAKTAAAINSIAKLRRLEQIEAETAKTLELGITQPQLSDPEKDKLKHFLADNWTRIYGTEPVGPRGGSDYATDIVADNKGNFYITGGYDSRTSPAYHVSNNMYDVIIAKLDRHGHIIWKDILNSGPKTSIFSSDLGIAIEVDNKGNSYVLGKTNGDLSSEGIVRQKYQSHYHFIAKYDTNGTQQWIRQFGTVGTSDALNDMAIDSKGNSYIVGGAFDYDTNTGKRTSEFNPVVFKFDTHGEKISFSSFPATAEYDLASAVTVDLDDNVYISGNKTSSANVRPYEIWVKKLSPTGAPLWSFKPTLPTPAEIILSRNPGLFGWISTSAMTFNAATNEVIVVGNRGDTPFTSSFSAASGALVRITLGSWGNYYNAVDIDGAGSIYITGQYGKNQVSPGNWGSDILFSKLSSVGALLSEASVGTVNSRDSGYGIAVDAAGNYVIAGSVAGDLNGVPSNGATMTSSDIVILKNLP
ncbi:MAG: hypothetical protein GXP08_01645 [Gammaproteobacteria bacterium]|nr:hypothetical protein [Gammaproteobacteria bacterium]